jgi:hypothetical protein
MNTTFLSALTLIAVAGIAGLRAAAALPASAQPWTQFVRIDPAFPHHFVREDGRHLFLFNKTAWHYFSAKDPQISLTRARNLGANVLRVALEGNTYLEALGLDAWPWGGTRAKPDYATFNEPYWDRVDARIRLAADNGIGLNLTLFKILKLPDTPASVALVRPYLERVIQRLARHPNIFCWEVHNEHVANPGFQAEVGRFLKTHDPRRRPVISSDGTTDYPLWPHADWMDLAVVHHCTGNQRAYDLRDWYLAIARNIRVFGKPAFNNETGREKRHQNDDPVHRRKQLWLAAAAGGYTTWHSWDGCEGIDDAAYRAPGEEFVRPFVDWWSGQQHWRVDPAFSVAQLAASDPRRDDLIPVALSTPQRDLLLIYLFTRSAGAPVTGARLLLRVPDGGYQVESFRPSDGAAIGQAQPFESRGLRGQSEIPLPDFSDDLALRITRLHFRNKSLIEGTR